MFARSNGNGGEFLLEKELLCDMIRVFKKAQVCAVRTSINQYFL